MSKDTGAEGGLQPSDGIRIGTEDSLDVLLVGVYPELRRMAAAMLRNERSDHTLQATALVHEVIVRLFRRRGVQAQNQAHLLAVAGRQMRHVLVDYARRRLAARRDGGLPLEQPVDAADPASADLESLLALDELLDQLRAVDPRAAEIVELRFFAGLSREEVAAHYGISVRTVQRDWDVARAWLMSAVQDRGGA